MIDVCVVVHKNYDLALKCVEHWDRLVGDEVRLLVLDNTPVAPVGLQDDRQRRGRRLLAETMTMLGAGRGWLATVPMEGHDGETHGKALDALVTVAESDVVALCDTDFFWTNPGILQLVRREFEAGNRCVGAAHWYEGFERAVDQRWPERASRAAPSVWGMFVERKLALEQTFVSRKAEAEFKAEGGWRLRQRLIRGNIPRVTFQPFRYHELGISPTEKGFPLAKDAVYFGTQEAPQGLHLLHGSSIRAGVEGIADRLVKVALDAWEGHS